MSKFCKCSVAKKRIVLLENPVNRDRVIQKCKNCGRVRSVKPLQVLTLEQAKSLKQGQRIYHTSALASDGTPASVRVTSVKTWKREPERVEIRVKYGLYDYFTVTPAHFSNWSISDDIDPMPLTGEEERIASNAIFWQLSNQ